MTQTTPEPERCPRCKCRHTRGCLADLPDTSALRAFIRAAVCCDLDGPHDECEFLTGSWLA
jgi:hypothetical protein